MFCLGRKRNRTGGILLLTRSAPGGGFIYFASVNQVKHGAAGTLTCDVGHSERLLALGPFGAAGIAPFAAARRGADAPQVHLGGFEEGHHEGLFILRPIAAN